MAGFFDLPSANARTKRDQQLLSKVSNPVKTSTSVQLKGSTKLIDRIESITSFVKSKFSGKEDELILITKEDDLIDYIDKCIENGVISIDTETTGLDPILDEIVGICIYTPEKKAAYIPLNHISYITELKCSNQLPIDFVRDQFQRLLDSNVKTIWFNAPFDIRFIGNKLGIWFTPYFDTSIAAMCLNSEEPEGSRSLKALHKKYCWGNRGEALTFGKLFDNIPFNLIPIDVAYLYAASDAIYTYELYEFQAQYLEPQGQYYESHNMQGVSNVFFNIEMKSMPTYISMEQNGVAVDYEWGEKIYKKYHDLSDKMKQNLEVVCKPYQDMFDDYKRKHPMCKLTDPINFDSPTQLAIIFYDILKLESPDKKNPRGTGSDILEQLDHPIARAVSDCKSFNKVLSAFIDRLPEDAKKYPDKRIHCSFKQYGAACVVGDTSILTPSGSMPISSIFNGDEESGISYDTDLTIINRNIEPEKASHRIVYRDVDTIRITLRGGYQIEGTPNHPVVCSMLTKNDILRNKSSKQISRLPENADFRMLSDIKIGDIVEIPYGYNIFPTEYVKACENDFNIDFIDEDFAEFLGMYHADGYIKTSSGGMTVCLCNDDPEVIERYSELCLKLFGIKCRTHVYKNNSVVTYCTCYRLRSIKRYLSFGARNKTMPVEIMRSPKSVICSYIRGMTLDSGFDSVRQRLYMTCVDKSTYNFIEQFLLNIGIFTCTRFGKYPSKNNHSGELCDEKETYRIGVSGEMYKRFLDEIGFIESCKVYNTDSYNHSWYLTCNSRYYAYVKKIEYRKADVYDLTVPETHSFISNGMISHNTGRVSCKSPNLQQIPSRPFVLSDGTEIDSGHDVRQLFTASPNHVLLSCDYSGQEVRVTAHLSQDEKLIQAYRDGKDPYCEIASLAYNVPYEECTEYRKDGTANPAGKKRRGEAKRIVLGILYGRGIPSIAEQLGKTVKEAQEIYDKVLEKFEGLAAFIEESEDMAREYGYVTTVWGRRRQLPDMQLPYYEFGYKNGFAPDFDPLSDDADEFSDEVPEDICRALTDKLLNCWGYKKREELKERIRQKGLTVKDNTSLIARSKRQTVNARVQGRRRTAHLH